MSIPKPKNCPQEWLSMKPSEKGRLCGECKKDIIDFTKKSWSEIEDIQKAHNNTLCGMYTDKQLKYWGQEVPPLKPNKHIGTAALILGLTTGVNGQTTHQDKPVKEKIIIKGKVRGEDTDGNALAFTNVVLDNTTIGTEVDMKGNYELDVSDCLHGIDSPSLSFSFIGYETASYPINKEEGDTIVINADLKLSSDDSLEALIFAVKKPTLWRRLKWSIKRLFSSNN